MSAISRRTLRRAAGLAAAAAAALGLAAPSAGAATSASPSLSDLPTLVKQVPGTTYVAVAFPTEPDPTMLRAAVAATSAFAGFSGHGAAAAPFIHPSHSRILSSPFPVVVIDPRPGAPALSLRESKYNAPILTVAGEGQGLVDAATLLSTDWISALNSSRATLSATLTAAVAKFGPRQGSEDLRPGSVSGNGSISLTRQVVLPPDKVVGNGDALLRLGVEYAAPGGGELSFSLNGHLLGTAIARGHGNNFDYRFRVASVWTDGPNLQPGYYLNPGTNTITITARPNRPDLVKQVGDQLGLAPHSDVLMKLTARRTQLQLGLWPFPLFDGSWKHTTVVTAPPAQLSKSSLSTLITALADTERLTGAAANPQITYSQPTAAQLKGNLLIYGNPERLAHVKSDTPLLPGMLNEQKLHGGGVALIADDSRALGALTAGAKGFTGGKTVVIDKHGRAHTIVKAPAPSAFATPKITWLKPAAGIAVLVLAWVALRVFTARRRLRARPQMPSGGVVS